ncbi:hypothetical protein [Polycladidibacter stylochi]|uniref:hypothetical protein n=1 Tax=Polycladidibacter stylochi TaxID=1807766 RepID=UPI0008364F21|nr:hypothetical protein [Pseudovibrio stylochi]
MGAQVFALDHERFRDMDGNLDLGEVPSFLMRSLEPSFEALAETEKAIAATIKSLIQLDGVLEPYIELHKQFLQDRKRIGLHRAKVKKSNKRQAIKAQKKLLQQQQLTANDRHSPEDKSLAVIEQRLQNLRSLSKGGQHLSDKFQERAEALISHIEEADMNHTVKTNNRFLWGSMAAVSVAIALSLGQFLYSQYYSTDYSTEADAGRIEELQVTLANLQEKLDAQNTLPAKNNQELADMEESIAIIKRNQLSIAYQLAFAINNNNRDTQKTLDKIEELIRQQGGGTSFDIREAEESRR